MPSICEYFLSAHGLKTRYNTFDQDFQRIVESYLRKTGSIPTRAFCVTMQAKCSVAKDNSVSFVVETIIREIFKIVLQQGGDATVIETTTTQKSIANLRHNFPAELRRLSCETVTPVTPHTPSVVQECHRDKDVHVQLHFHIVLTVPAANSVIHGVPQPVQLESLLHEKFTTSNVSTNKCSVCHTCCVLTRPKISMLPEEYLIIELKRINPADDQTPTFVSCPHGSSIENQLNLSCLLDPAAEQSADHNDYRYIGCCY